VVTADGGRIQARPSDKDKEDDEKGGVWKEDKVGAIYDASPRKDPAAREAPEYDGAKALMKTYAATALAQKRCWRYARFIAVKTGAGTSTGEDERSPARVIIHADNVVQPGT